MLKIHKLGQEGESIACDFLIKNILFLKETGAGKMQKLLSFVLKKTR